MPARCMSARCESRRVRSGTGAAVRLLHCTNLVAMHKIIYTGPHFAAESADLITRARPQGVSSAAKRGNPPGLSRLAGSSFLNGDTTGKGVIMNRVWIAGAAVAAAVAFPLAQSRHMSAKAAAAKVA